MVMSAAWTLCCLLTLSTIVYAYDSSLPPWDVDWSAAEISSQTTAGQTLVQNVQSALAANVSSYTIPPGTYRLASSLMIQDTTNFVLNAANVELISGTGGEHFVFVSNTNVSLQGPIYLDGDPWGSTQAILVGTDNATYIELQTMSQYADPIPGSVGRLQFFTSNGTMLALYQVTPSSISQLSNGHWQFILPTYFWTQYTASLPALLQTGNLVRMEVTTAGIGGGVTLRSNNGVSLTQVAVYSSALLFAQYETGPIFLDQWYGIRRPGTNRLGAGGYPLVGLQGGSWEMINSELGYNFDDLTDVQSGVQYAYNQISPTQVYLQAVAGRAPEIGDTFNFYNLQNLSSDGVAKLAAIAQNTDTSINTAFSNALTNAGLPNQTTNLTIITLDRPIQLTSLLQIADITEFRSPYIVYENCYIHDSLAAGIAGKGAKEYVVKNCSVARAGNGGISTSVDPYWLEGAVSGNILIQDNVVEDCPYSLGVYTGAIATSVTLSGSLLAQANSAILNNVTISNNTIINPPGPGIELQFASNINITGNAILNPVSAVGAQTTNYSEPIATASAIYLDVIGGSAQVAGNLVINVDVQNVPQIIAGGPDTNTSFVQLCSNAAAQQPLDNLLMRLPNELWTTVYPNSSSVTTNANFNVESFDTDSARVSGTVTVASAAPHTATTFTFTGTGAQFLTCTGPQYGLARIYMDGSLIEDIDASVSPAGAIPDPTTGFCDQAVYQNTLLSAGQHNLTVEILQQRGAGSYQNATNVVIGSFAYLTGTNQCTPSSDPASTFAAAETYLSLAYNNWVNYESVGIVGPNYSTVVFGDTQLETFAPIQLPAEEPAAFSPAAVVPVLAPYNGPSLSIAPAPGELFTTTG